MNGNSSKQVLLSVLGIAILVVAVVGVSFAFFSYTKTGSTTNTISTGSIYTYLTNGDTMTLTNAMPVQTTPTSIIPDSTATVEEGEPKGTTGDIGVLSFSVTGINQSDIDMKYRLYLVPGTAEAVTALNRTTLIDDSDIGLLMSSTGTGGTPVPAITTATTVGAKITANGGSRLSDGAYLGEATIPKNTNTEVTHSYTINMWVSGETVRISDTDLSVNGTAPKYCASAHTGNPQASSASGNSGCELYYTDAAAKTGLTKADASLTTLPEGAGWLPVYSTAYYTARIRVVANTTTTAAGLANTYGE